MNLVLVLSILLRVVGVGYSLVLLHQSRDRRFLFLTAMLSLMATRQLWTAVTTTKTGLSEVPGLVVSGLALLTVYYLSRYIEEEDRIKASLREVNERLRSFRKAVEHAGHAIFLTDPDGTITYANPAIESVTGYEPDEVVGANPRLWKSGEHDEAFYEQLWQEITSGNVWDGEIVNERKDGDRCWVDMTIAPITGEDGDVERFVAVDTDVTDRKERQLRIEEQNEELTLLNNTNEILRDVNQRLVEATTREEIETAVCECFAREPFSFAWLSSVNLVNGSLDVRTQAGISSAEIETLVTAFNDADGMTPVDRARHESTAVRTVFKTDDDEWQERCRQCGTDAVAAIPLTHRGVTYGTLVVHAETRDAFAAVEGNVLEELGETIGFALNAVQSKRALVTDDVTELEFRVTEADDPLVRLAAELDCELELTRITTDAGQQVEYFSVTGAGADEVTDYVASAPHVTAAQIIRDHADGCIVRFVVDDTAVVSALAEYGTAVRSFSVTPSEGRLSVDLPSDGDPRTLLDALRDSRPGIELVARREHEQPQSVTVDTVDALTEDLTDRQQESLRTAHEAGFFAWPRETNGDDVAELLDISQSTFLQHLRTAERKVFDELFETTAATNVGETIP